MLDLYQCLYLSESTIPTTDRKQWDREIADILTSSQRNNAESVITGALVCDGKTFVQVLEGRHAEVRATFNRIGKDPRHKRVSVLHFEPIRSRTFSAWKMVMCPPTEEIVSLPLDEFKLVDGESEKRSAAERLVAAMSHALQGRRVTDFAKSTIADSGGTSP